MGSSHAFYAVNPEFITSKSFNAAHDAQSLDYDVEILKKYVQQMDKLQFIVVPIDYFSLYNRLETGDQSRRIKIYNIYYGFNKSYKLADNLEILNGKWSDNIKKIKEFLKNKKTEITCEKLGWGTICNSKNKKDFVVTGKLAAKRHYKRSKSFFEENLAVVNEIISFAKAKNAKVIFYTSPAYKTYTSQLQPE